MKLLLLTMCMLGNLSENIFNVAKSFLDVPYVAGTLEVEGDERLVVNTDSLDCTTFVELSVARWLASDSVTFEQQVQTLRYRDGVVDGYLSRLHYFTDWVGENERRGVWHELSGEDGSTGGRYDTLCTLEKRYAQYPVSYIDKAYLHLSPNELPIRTGDILALVTSIEGLDVTHLGFAVWKGDKLHLMHASMTHKKVVVDERTLYDYLQTRKSCPGVRVVRLLDR